MSYTLITKAEAVEGNMSASMADVMGILMGVKDNNNYSNQVFKTGEIVLTDERCCDDGRKYWKWDIDYEEGFETIEDAKKRAKELKITPTIHERCSHD